MFTGAYYNDHVLRCALLMACSLAGKCPAEDGMRIVSKMEAMKVSRKALLAIVSAMIAVALVPVLAYAGPAQLQGSSLSVGSLDQDSTTIEGEGTLNLIQSGDYHPESKGAGGQYSKRSSSSLSSEQEAAFRSRLTMCMASRQQSVDVSDLGIVASDQSGLRTLVSSMISDIINSNPDLFYVKNAYTYYIQDLEGYGTILTTIIPRYEYDLDAIDAMVASYELSMQDVLSWIPENATKAQQVKAVHDWFVYNCSYNDDAANEGSDSYINMNPWNAYGALVDKRPVCQGYSLAFIAVMNRLGIPCTFVTQDAAPGDSAGHGWNRIELDGEWYNLDVTWDDPTTSNQGTPHTTYFLKSDQWFRDYAAAHNQKYHTQWAPEGVPGTDTTYDNVQDWPVYSGPASGALAVTDFELPQSITLDADGSQVLSISSIVPVGVNADLARARATWSSSDESVVYVDSFGKVFAGSTPGTTDVTCEIDGVAKTCSVTVSDPLGLQTGEIGGKLGTCKWVLSADHTTLTVSPLRGDEGMFRGRPTAWNDYKSEITSVTFTGAICAVGSLDSMFNGYTSLETVNLSGLDTSAVTSMRAMFYNCSVLGSLDLSGFNTANVTNMQWMFGYCSSLSSLVLDALKFDTSNVTDMSLMFCNCSSLDALDVSHFNTSSVTDMNSMFCNCSSLDALDVSHFSTSNVTDMSQMFYNCSSLDALDVSHFNTSSVADMNSMFYNCSKLSSLDLSGFETTNVTNMQWMLGYCSSLSYLDVSSFDTSSLTANGFKYFIYNCPALSEIRVGEGYTTSQAGDFFFPASTSNNGKWWSTADGAWYTVNEIAEGRRGVADLYANYEHPVEPITFGHKLGDWVVDLEPTCAANGSRHRSCSNCDYTETESIAALSHAWANVYTVDVQATCIEPGSESIHCSVCGASDASTSRPIPTTGHSWADEYTVDVEATCTAEGSESIHCAVCGVKEEGSDRAIAKLPHAYGDWTATKAPTCTEPGEQKHTCSLCGAVETGAVPALDHDWEDWSVATPATCTADGVETRVCRHDATHEETRSVKALGHSWDSGKVTRAATYSSAGIRTFTCSKCGSTRTESIPMLARTPIGQASVSMLLKVMYTGEAITPSPTVKVGSKTLVKGTDYTLAYRNNTNVGKAATVVISGKGAYSGTKSVVFEVAKASNTATPAKTKVKKAIKAKSLQKKAKTVALPKVTTSFGTAKWKVAKKDGKKVLTLKAGKVKVKKGAKAGTYTIKLRAVVIGTTNYASAKTKVVTVRVTVK